MEKAGSLPKSAAKASTSAAGAGKANKRQKVADPSGTDRTSSELMEELFTPYAISEKVWVISRGQWHRADIVQQSEDVHPENELTVPTSRVHYPGWSVKYDEWVMHDSVMADTPENAIKAEAENEAERAKTGTTKSAKKKQTKKVPTKLAASKSLGSKAPSKELSRPPSVEAPRKAESSDDDEGLRRRATTSKTIPAKITKATGKRPSRATSASTGEGGNQSVSLPPPEPMSMDESATGKEETVRVKDEAAASDEKMPSSGDDTTPRVSPSSSEDKSDSAAVDDTSVAGGPASVSRVEETPVKENAKKERSLEDFNLLCDSYDDYDPAKPDEQSPEEKLLMLQFFMSVGSVPEVPTESGVPRTKEEREATCMDSLRKLSYITLAKRQKALDVTNLKVTLPAGLKKLMADNYIQTVRNAKILKPAKPQYCIGTILTAYRNHCEKNPRPDKSYYWNMARLAEITVFQDIDIFQGLLQTFLLRHEWPQMDDWKKAWKKEPLEGFQRYGFLHLARYIQLMSYHHNSEAKRLVGRMGQQLMAIYDDLLNFIDSEYVANLSDAELEDLYMEVDEAYIARIKFLTYGPAPANHVGEARHIVYPFHQLSDAFFEELAKMDEATVRDCGLKVTWKPITTTGMSVDD